MSLDELKLERKQIKTLFSEELSCVKWAVVEMQSNFTLAYHFLRPK